MDDNPDLCRLTHLFPGECECVVGVGEDGLIVPMLGRRLDHPSLQPRQPLPVARLTALILPM
jgi:hypothetical protein